MHSRVTGQPTCRTKIRTYSEMIRLKTFNERFDYLKLDGNVGIATFGFDRYLNQSFYKSVEWKKIRNYVITRDHGCDLNQMFYRSKEWRQIRHEIIVRDNGLDLSMPGYEIFDRIYIHHMNPINVDDIVDRSDYLLNPEYLVCVSFDTHNAIHYGNRDLLIPGPIERRPNDTCPWKK